MKIKVKMNGQNGLRFEIISTRTIEPENRKKYLVYKIVVLNISEVEDPNPAVFERRYNEFLSLYNGLKREFPNQLSGFQFPRKAILGNFSSEIIVSRSYGFEALLSLIGSESQLRHSPIVVSFLQNKELEEVIRLIQLKCFEQAKPLVENSFQLINKVQTDRSPAVLRWLCLLVCVCWNCGDSRAVNLASLAIRRYQAVSDIDLLRYYIPLLHLAKKICRGSSAETQIIANQLGKLKASGMAIDHSQDLLTMLIEDLSKLMLR